MLKDLATLKARVDDLRTQATTRDACMRQVNSVREGNIETLAPDLFESEMFEKSMIANFIDTAARDMAEMLAPLPALSCASGSMKTDKDKERAAKKNKIGTYVWESSNLEQQMFWGADQYATYGFMCMYVAPDEECRVPVIYLEDPVGVYYENDHRDRTRVYVKTWRMKAIKLAALFPEYRTQILTDDRGGEVPPQTEMDLIRYCDDEVTVLFLPNKNLVLEEYENITDKCPARVIEWPTLRRGLVRGRFDDLIWVQIARAAMAQLALSAGWQAVNAPIVLPEDANEFPMGPNAIFRTNGKVGRVPLEIPQSAFAIDQTLERELEQGSRHPGVRNGNIQGSIVTGRGIQELLGSFDSQLKMAQTMLGAGLKAITSVALEMFEKFYPGSRTVNGTFAGESYTISFDPSKDIGGNYTCECTYGFAAGLSPQNAIVMLLQLRGDNLIDRDTVRRQMPWYIDPDQVQREIDVQELRDGLRQGLSGLAQATPQMIAQGQDPSAVFKALAAVVEGRRNGEALEALVQSAFAPAEPPPAAPEAPGAGQLPPGGPEGVVPGQTGPGGMPDIQTLMAGMRNGKPVLDASVMRRIPA